ncbi:MAG: DnaJ C-terminal domain-containing protein [Pseudoclavibacter sp.]|nr:DnaJ C-terminal domain-containing protein [Pseudoclavibacter sp.]
MASQDWFDKDFYAVLGVSKDVSEQDLKKRYRRLAREHHPDQHPGDAAAEAKFKEISEAYSVLSDPEQRAEYDQIRAMGAGARFRPGPGGQGGGFEDVFGGMFGQGAGRQQYTNADFEDLLGGMFGAGQGFGAGPGAAGFGRGGFGGPMRGRDQTASTTLGFMTAIRGDTVQLQTGEGRTITVRIPAGVEDGQKIRLRGKGAPSPDGGEPGDLILHVRVRPHPVFQREGDDLRVQVPVTFAEAVRGATIEVPTADGGTVKVKVPAHSQSGRVLRVKGRGVATKKGTGNLLVELQVAVPERLNREQEQALDAFVAASPDASSPREDLLRSARQSS